MDALAEDLLAGPRGRDVCAALARQDPGRIAALTDPAALLEPLVASVGNARYWQEPVAHEAGRAGAEARAALEPVAGALARAPAAAWWFTGLERDRQHALGWVVDGRDLDPPMLVGAAAELAEWAGDTRISERRSIGQPASSGHWWSTPALTRVPVTSRAEAGLDAVGLVLAEDFQGFSEAVVWPLTVGQDPEVYEVDGPAAYVELVGHYPMEVTHSRRWDWARLTGRQGRWLIPDWAAAAADYDAVHLTVAGYLATAGRALEVEGGAATVLGGWNPDATYWLTDSVAAAGPPARWRSTEDFTVWERVPG